MQLYKVELKIIILLNMSVFSEFKQGFEPHPTQ